MFIRNIASLGRTGVSDESQSLSAAQSFSLPQYSKIMTPIFKQGRGYQGELMALTQSWFPACSKAAEAVNNYDGYSPG
jgi:hypothetical protein